MVALVAVGFLVGRFTAPGDGASPVTTTSQAPTTTAAPSLAVTPESGTVGSTFTFAAHGFHPGRSAQFEVTFPSGRLFKGDPHPVGADGTAIASYTATSGNPAGAYQVKVTDDEGASATGSFVVGGAGTGTTARRSTATTAA